MRTNQKCLGDRLTEVAHGSFLWKTHIIPSQPADWHGNLLYRLPRRFAPRNDNAGGQDDVGIVPYNVIMSVPLVGAIINRPKYPLPGRGCPAGAGVERRSRLDCHASVRTGSQ